MKRFGKLIKLFKERNRIHKQEDDEGTTTSAEIKVGRQWKELNDPPKLGDFSQ